MFGSPLEVAEITDSWAEIIAACQNGTYATKYKVGNYKELDLGAQGTIHMQIAAKDSDPLASGGGNAPLTWVSMELLKTKKRFNPDIVTNYKYPEVAAWTASGNTWTSQNRYVANSSASATWTITATAAGTLSIKYKTSNSGTTSKITVTVNGTAVATDYTSNTEATHTVECAANDTVTVEATYTGTASNNYYGQVVFSSTGTFTVSANVGTTTTRQLDYYSEGTGAIGGWGKSELRTYMRETIKPLIPETVRNGIKNVTKYSGIYNTAGTLVKDDETTDDVWLPSYKEMFNSTSTETKGKYFNALFPDNASRIKKVVGESSASWWWLRSAASYNSVCNVYGNGNFTGSYAYYTGGLVVGFCT